MLELYLLLAKKSTSFKPSTYVSITKYPYFAVVGIVPSFFVQVVPSVEYAKHRHCTSSVVAVFDVLPIVTKPLFSFISFTFFSLAEFTGIVGNVFSNVIFMFKRSLATTDLLSSFTLYIIVSSLLPPFWERSALVALALRVTLALASSLSVLPNVTLACTG